VPAPAPPSPNAHAQPVTAPSASVAPDPSNVHVRPVHGRRERATGGWFGVAVPIVAAVRSS
jgi:hypothetical protein